MTDEEAARYLSDRKAGSAGTCRWLTKHDWERDANHMMMGVERSGFRDGDLLITRNPRIPDRWSFILLVKRVNVIRWDFGTRPHGNRDDCAFRPNGQIEAPHEHLWNGVHDGCATPLSVPALDGFEPMLIAFAKRVNLDLPGAVPPPPPMQLEMETGP